MTLTKGSILTTQIRFDDNLALFNYFDETNNKPIRTLYARVYIFSEIYVLFYTLV